MNTDSAAQHMQNGEQLCTPHLRSRTARVERLHSLLQQRIRAPRADWTFSFDPEHDPALRDTRLLTRHAMMLEQLFMALPIWIDTDDLIAGLALDVGCVISSKYYDFATIAEQEQAAEEGSKILYWSTHKVPAFGEVLAKGICGIVLEIDEKIREITTRPTTAEHTQKLCYFAAMRRECLAVVGLSRRFAVLADRLAAEASEARQRKELVAMAERCRRVPEQPPICFADAVQSIWMLQFALAYAGNGTSLGRLDQLLAPYLECDLEDGTITLAEAQELIDCLWLRLNDRIEMSEMRPETKGVALSTTGFVWDIGHRRRAHLADDRGSNHHGQSIFVGGYRPDGSDGENMLTWLMLNSVEKFEFVQPDFTLRLHANSSPRLMRRAAEVLKHGGAFPYINNDDVIVPALMQYGIPAEDARDYAATLCWETLIQGKTDQEQIRGNNLALITELVLTRGRTRVSNEQLGPDTGDPCTFAIFKDFLTVWKIQADRQFELAIEHVGDNIRRNVFEPTHQHGKYSNNPLLSAFIQDCIANEKDVTKAGARYTIWVMMFEAFATAVDALFAIKKLVFDRHEVTMRDFVTATDANWEGWEHLRQTTLNRVAHYGQGDSEVDALGREILEFAVTRMREYAVAYPEMIVIPAVGTVSWTLVIGAEVGATPDGRLARTAISANMSPALGQDRNGPTAAIESYVAMPLGKLAGGAPLDLNFSTREWDGEEGTHKLATFIETFLRLGGNMLTLTATNVAELRQAMDNPEAYRGLRVRMGGWTGYFVQMSRQQQENFITRVAHGG